MNYINNDCSTTPVVSCLRRYTELDFFFFFTRLNDNDFIHNNMNNTNDNNKKEFLWCAGLRKPGHLFGTKRAQVWELMRCQRVMQDGAKPRTWSTWPPSSLHPAPPPTQAALVVPLCSFLHWCPVGCVWGAWCRGGLFDLHVIPSICGVTTERSTVV